MGHGSSAGLIMRAALLAFCAVCASAFADDFKLTDGREYKDVKVSRVEPDGLIVGTESGVVKLFFVELAKDVQEKYQYDPKKAEAFRFRLDAARDAAADEVAAAAERQKSAQGGSKPSNPAPTPPDENRAVRSLSLE